MNIISFTTWCTSTSQWLGGHGWGLETPISVFSGLFSRCAFLLLFELVSADFGKKERAGLGLGWGRVWRQKNKNKTAILFIIYVLESEYHLLKIVLFRVAALILTCEKFFFFKVSILYCWLLPQARNAASISIYKSIKQTMYSLVLYL